MKIDKYDAVVENGAPVFYAVKGKQRIRMPDAFSDMYNDDYLEIEKVSFEMPEVFGLTEPTAYIPRRTAE